MTIAALWKRKARANLQEIVPTIYEANRKVLESYYGKALNIASRSKEFTNHYRSRLVRRIGILLASNDQALDVEVAAKWLGAIGRQFFSTFTDRTEKARYRVELETDAELRVRLNNWLGEHCAYCGSSSLVKQGCCVPRQNGVRK